MKNTADSLARECFLSGGKFKERSCEFTLLKAFVDFIKPPSYICEGEGGR